MIQGQDFQIDNFLTKLAKSISSEILLNLPPSSATKLFQKQGNVLLKMADVPILFQITAIPRLIAPPLGKIFEIIASLE